MCDESCVPLAHGGAEAVAVAPEDAPQVTWSGSTIALHTFSVHVIRSDGGAPCVALACLVL